MKQNQSSKKLKNATTKDKTKKEKKAQRETLELFEQIGQNYTDLNAMMEREIALTSAHGTLTGSHREHMWYKFFRSIIPLKYSMAQGVMIIDSERGVSKEVDIAVYDEQYTPYVFQYNTLKFIPIEAVSVVIECKSQSAKREDLMDWAYSIRRLKPSQTGLARMVTGYATGLTNLTQSRTRPIFILAAYSSKISKNDRLELGNFFDFILQKDTAASRKNKEKLDASKNGSVLSGFSLYNRYEERSLGWWADQLNQAKDVNKYKVPGATPKVKYKFSNLQLEQSEEQQLRILDRGLSIEQLKTYTCKEGYKGLKLSYTLTTDKHNNGEKQSVEQKQKSEQNISKPKLEKVVVENTLDDLKVEDNPLLSLNLQLNQLLMLVNNPMLFPHFAYAKAFNKSLNKQ